MPWLPWLAPALTVLLLTACGHTTVTQTVAAAISGGADVDALRLNPHLRYLRVTLRGRTALMVLGYVDAHPSGEIETWYSGKGEVIRLQEGRIVSTSGLETDWRMVRHDPLPAWDVLLTKSRLDYRRERDEMPGYRYGIAETVALRVITAPADSQLVGMRRRELKWFAETVLGPGINGKADESMQSARYALRADGGKARVVYADQCLKPGFCLAWQAWPVSQ